MRKTILLSACLIMLSLTACKDDELTFDIPTTYNFENVSYSGQLDRLGMLGELKSYIASVTSGTTLDAGRLAAMYANESAIANWQGIYSDKQIRNKTNASQQAVFEALLGLAAADSQNANTASNGTAGIITSLDGNHIYFVNANGLEYAQVIEKGLMGALIMYQQTGVYLESGKMDVDNRIIVPEEGTAMEHHWDESFGYFGVSPDFPTNTSDAVFWGNYCHSRNDLLSTNPTIMNAYLKGRAAISNNDLDTRDEQIDIIQNTMDEIAASTTIHYLNSAITNFNDPALRLHALSEATAFHYSQQFNPDTRIPPNQLYQNLALMGGAENFEQMNFWNVQMEDLATAKSNITATYGWDSTFADQF